MDNKAFIAVLVCGFLALSATITVTHSQNTVPAPSVPMFSLKLVAKPGNAPSVELTITSQPYSYSNNGVNYTIFYDVRTKIDSEENWTELYDFDSVASSEAANQGYLLNSAPPQNGLNYTILDYPYTHKIGFNSGSPTSRYPPDAVYSSNAKIDFQVRAVAGYSSQFWVGNSFYPLYQSSGYYEPAVAYNTSSSWSDTQMITLPNFTTSDRIQPQTPLPSPSPTVTSTPTQVIIQSVPTWFYVSIVGLVAIIAVLLGIIIIQKKRKDCYE